VSLFAEVKNLFRIPSDKPELVQAQVKAFSRQIPLLYAILLANMAFVSATHFDRAPKWMVLYAPVVFATLAVFRIGQWWRRRKHHLSAEAALKKLRSTIVLSADYGDAYQQGHVAFFMSVTMVACVFCLMHLRAAAFILTLTVVSPLVVQLSMMGNPIMVAIAANMALVAGGMLYILSKHYDEFATMVEQKLDLEKTNIETQRLSDENYLLANKDALTGLPNRRSFISQISKCAEAAASDDRSFAVGLLDLDGFKAVNDLYGHVVGDMLLVEASKRLTLLADKNVIFARLGGDEFGFIFTTPENASTFGIAICDSLRQPYLFEDISVSISASCGIAIYPTSSKLADELIEFADYALYQAKHNANGKALIFNTSHRDQLRISHQVDQALRNADLHSEMTLAYQPIIDFATSETVALEGLARWSNRMLGNVSPAQFITTAERSPIINKVTLHLLNCMLRDMRSMPEDMRVSFNLSAKSLAMPDVMLQILSTIQRSGVDPRRIDFEVTESALMADFDGALRALSLLRNLGSRIALDDFGTGYSSLSYVHQLPLDKIKIDRRFITDLATDLKARNVVKTVIGLSRDINVKCVAEGVETQDQVLHLIEIGCTLMQGYYFAKPQTLSDIAKTLGWPVKSGSVQLHKTG
jgi:diguanylate cyclase (GGDEF)-like protein